MKPERISPDRVRVRATIPAAAWQDFEALVPRFRPASPEAIFEMVLTAGLRHMADLADRDDRVRALASKTLEGVPPGAVVTGAVA